MPWNELCWNSKFQSKLHKYANRMRKKPSPIERKVKRYLEELGQLFINQDIVGPYICDFVHPEWMLIIECDGAKWHSSEEQRYKDLVRNETLAREGYRILHLLGWQCWDETIAKGLICDFLANCGHPVYKQKDSLASIGKSG